MMIGWIRRTLNGWFRRRTPDYSVSAMFMPPDSNGTSMPVPSVFRINWPGRKFNDVLVAADTYISKDFFTQEDCDNGQPSADDCHIILDINNLSHLSMIPCLVDKITEAVQDNFRLHLDKAGRDLDKAVQAFTKAGIAHRVSRSPAICMDGNARYNRTMEAVWEVEVDMAEHSMVRPVVVSYSQGRLHTYIFPDTMWRGCFDQTLADIVNTATGGMDETKKTLKVFLDALGERRVAHVKNLVKTHDGYKMVYNSSVGGLYVKADCRLESFWVDGFNNYKNLPAIDIDGLVRILDLHDELVLLASKLETL